MLIRIDCYVETPDFSFGKSGHHTLYTRTFWHSWQFHWFAHEEHTWARIGLSPDCWWWLWHGLVSPDSLRSKGAATTSTKLSLDGKVLFLVYLDICISRSHRGKDNTSVLWEEKSWSDATLKTEKEGLGRKWKMAPGRNFRGCLCCLHRNFYVARSSNKSDEIFFEH